MRLTIIGAGPGGYAAALKAAQLGAQVTVIEETEAGGTCLNRGCIPTKTLIASTDVLHKAKNLADFGIENTGVITPNLSRIMERKDKVVATLVKGIRALFKSRGVTLIEGRGMLLSPGEVEVRKKDSSTEIIRTDKILIATGSRPARMPTFPFDGEQILSSDDALTIKSIPRDMIIVGAGVIGCEFACIFRELGAEVTILETLPRAISSEDPEISEVLERELKKKKIKLMTGVNVVKVEGDKSGRNDGVHVFIEGGKELVAEKLLVSIGRSLNTEDLGLEALGIEKTSRGGIRVNEHMETNVAGIYAAGDVTGRILLAHVASKEGIVAACNACGVEMKMDHSVVPAGIFTSPEIGSVGLREHQAEGKGLKIKTGRFHFRALGKAHAMGEISGMIKIIADADSDKVLGAHIIGPHASDLVHEGALAIKAGLTARDMADMIHAHPTLAEGVMEAAEDAQGR